LSRAFIAVTAAAIAKLAARSARRTVLRRWGRVPLGVPELTDSIMLCAAAFAFAARARSSRASPIFPTLARPLLLVVMV
jgi:hypothetical protein